MNESFLRIAEIISLDLSVPAIVLGAIVVYIWFHAAITAFFTKYRDSFHWFVIGVFSSFLASDLDSSYWYATWFGTYVESNFGKVLFYHGVIANIIFRQMGDIIAAYCHIRAAIEFNRAAKNIKVRLPYFCRTVPQLNKLTIYLTIAGFPILWTLTYIHKWLWNV